MPAQNALKLWDAGHAIFNNQLIVDEQGRRARYGVVDKFFHFKYFFEAYLEMKSLERIEQIVAHHLMPVASHP